MNSKADILALRYAKAWMHVYGAESSWEQIQAFSSLGTFFLNKPELVFFCNLSLVPYAQKEERIYQLIDHYNLPQYYVRICLVLIKEQRMSLFPKITSLIKVMYAKLYTLYLFTISSTQLLEDHEKMTIETYLSGQVKGTIICQYILDKHLYAGIKISNNSLCWEYSIEKKLKNSKQALHHWGTV